METILKIVKQLGISMGLILALSTAAFAAQNITVVIDGTPYTCGSNSGGGGNKCECIVRGSGTSWHWEMYKLGNRVNSDSYLRSREIAVDNCAYKKATTPTCFE